MSKIEDDLRTDVNNSTIRDNKRRRLENSSTPKTNRSIEFEELKHMLATFVRAQNARLDVIEQKISQVTSQNASIQNTNLEIEKSIAFVSDKLEDLQKNISVLEKDRKNIATQIDKIEFNIESVEKSVRKTSLEIRNVPKIRGENKETLFGYIHAFSNKINYPLELSKLRDVYRLPSKAEVNTSTLIAEFENTLVKSKITEAIKNYKKQNTKEHISCQLLGINQPNTPIYTSDFLTNKAKRLHYLAREAAKTLDYAYCWVANGNVFLRKKEGDLAIHIKNEAQLIDLKKPK